MRALATLVLAVLVFGARPARAEDGVAEQPSWIVSLPLFALSSNALAVQVERPLAARWSGVAVLGIRDGADGDYSSLGLAAGAEVRAWWKASQRGLFAGARIELLVTRVSSTRMDRTLGTATLIDEGLVLGYRFVIARRVEVTPILGAALRHDIGHRDTPSTTRLSPWYGLTLGWLFP